MAGSKGFKPVTIYGFKGMNNLPNPPAPLVDRQGKAAPHFCVNCDVFDSGTVKKATGYTFLQSLPNLHSLAGEEMGLSVLLGVVDGILSRLEPATGTVMPLATIGPRAPLSYAEVSNRVYISSAFANGVYNLISGEMETWGVALPGVPPDVSLCAGNLPPGKYSICYSRVDGDRVSGNGPVRKFEFQGQASGLQLNNMEGDFQVWLTQVNQAPLFLAETNYSDQITASVPEFNPFRAINVLPPPCFNHFVFANGRFWGVEGRNLHYSEPNEFRDLGWFSRKTIPFLENLVMVSSFNSGLYVSSLNSTWSLKGTDPGKMEMERVGSGAIPGTLVFAQIPAKLAGGAVPTMDFGELSMMPTPVWRSPTGWVVGTHGGHLTLITERHLKVARREQGASLFRWQDGIPQIITSLWGTAQGEDTETKAIFQGGWLFAQPAAAPGMAGLLLGASL